jgi:hypothetical protein
MKEVNRMIKLEALENFSLERFKEVKNIKRAGKDTFGMIIKGDVFECEKDLADYLLGANPLGRPVVKVIEVEPKKTIEEFKEEVFKKDALEFIEKTKPKKKKSSKK